MLIIFSVNDQKITHDLKGQLVAGSVDIVQAAFKFDSSWDELDKIVVFTSSACPKPVPVQFADEAFYIPKDVLKTCEAHVQSAHAPANAEENVIVSIQRNGQAIPPDNKVVNIEVPTKTSALENDSGYATTEDVEEKVNGAGHLKAVPVDTLPAPSEANANTIYFLRKNNSEAGKQYRAYKLIHGIFEIVGSAEVDLTSYATRESVAKADDGLIKGIYNNMTASSEKYLGSGNLLLFWTLLKSLLNGHESSINDLLARVKLLELILSADVTGNPYYVTFNTLTDVVVSSGIWNKSDGRIEF